MSFSWPALTALSTSSSLCVGLIRCLCRLFPRNYGDLVTAGADQMNSRETQSRSPLLVGSLIRKHTRENRCHFSRAYSTAQVRVRSADRDFHISAGGRQSTKTCLWKRLVGLIQSAVWFIYSFPRGFNAKPRGSCMRLCKPSGSVFHVLERAPSKLMDLASLAN